jgi:NAD(P)-dependent dehydrogenase (short-subunit alcohol dehydrogenase family)
MPTYVVTGAASGIGAASCARLRAAGARVIGVDLADAEVRADLGSPDGRRAAIERITELADGDLTGLVPAAGIGGSSTAAGGRLVSINYFGAVSLVEGLRPLLAAGDGGAVVLLGSNSATVQPGWPVELAEACLAGDEAAACALADRAPSLQAYPATKAALAWYVRERAPRPEWIGAGVRLNAIAPGLTETALTQTQRADPLIGPALANFPVPLGRALKPAEIADAIAFLLSSPVLVGSVLVADGGTEAQLRPRDWPALWQVSG